MKRVFSALLAVVLILAALPLKTQAKGNPIPKASQAVVCIYSGIFYRNGTVSTYDGHCYTGTGFGVGNAGKNAQIFITNNHVVCDDRNRPYNQVYILVDNADATDESSVVPCQILYADPEIDVAVIQAQTPIPGVGTLPLRSAGEIKTGDSVYALGFPGVADVVADSNRYTVDDITVTDGIISRHLQSNGVDCVAHTAKINHGNSGGPLIDAAGNAVGINSFGFTDVENADQRGYAIYIDYAMEALEKLGLPYATGKTDEFPFTAAIIAATFLALLMGAWVLRKNAADNEEKTPPKRILLQGIRGPLQGKSWELFASLSIGRSSGESIVLPADTPGISRVHCLITRQGNQATVTDQGSSYGTFLNGVRLTANQPVPVPNGAVISLASDAVQFRILIT